MELGLRLVGEAKVPSRHPVPTTQVPDEGPRAAVFDGREEGAKLR